MSSPANFSRKLGLITFLTFIFIVDDILIYYLLKYLYNWEVSLSFFALGISGVLALNFSLAIIIYRVMQKKPTTGREGMIGKTATVLHKLNHEGLVKVQGEIWRAESTEPIKAGEKVIIEGVEGLKLHVRHQAK